MDECLWQMTRCSIVSNGSHMSLQHSTTARPGAFLHPTDKQSSAEVLCMITQDMDVAVQSSPDRRRDSALSKVKAVAEGLEEELFLAESLRHDAEVSFETQSQGMGPAPFTTRDKAEGRFRVTGPQLPRRHAARQAEVRGCFLAAGPPCSR